MPVSTARQWLDIGPAELTFNSKILGETVANPDGGSHGGVGVQISTSNAEVRRDAKGLYDKIINDQSVMVQANLTGLALDQLVECIPGAAISTGPTKKQLVLGSAIGKSHRAGAKALVIKPILENTVSVDNAEWLEFALAFPEPNIDFAFDLENQKVYSVTFVIYKDNTNHEFGTIGEDAT